MHILPDTFLHPNTRHAVSLRSLPNKLQSPPRLELMHPVLTYTFPCAPQAKVGTVV